VVKCDTLCMSMPGTAILGPFEAESSIERDDSFDASLEDIEKTPVVLPEDWRFMSLETPMRLRKDPVLSFHIH
jgi:hypothetical protein